MCRKDVHWKDQLVQEGSACISLYRKDQLVLEGLAWQQGSACTERTSLYWKDQLVLEGLARTGRISLCITLM